ncbi:helix-turn-helix domain-containing protein [Streptomyces coffeae]|uniref:helix-turn-helix domain-containing protein n=1 Tax=Streptomyces coffeae TaxID=621382 RepID=UPI0022A87654|nr:helix-turn-helix domain-containing protein [Streptomyces coffeae]
MAPSRTETATRISAGTGTRSGAARGARLGRPPAMTPKQIQHARDLLSRPKNTVTSIAKLLGVSHNTIYKYVPELKGGGRTGLAEAEPVPTLPGPAEPAE